MRCESVRPGARQVVHEAGDSDEEQEKQEHQVEHEQGVQGHQLHRARATRFTITRVHPRSERPIRRACYPQSLFLSFSSSFSLTPSRDIVLSVFSRSRARDVRLTEAISFRL